MAANPTLKIAAVNTPMSLSRSGRRRREEPLRRRPEIEGLLADHAPAERAPARAGLGLDPLGGLHGPVAHDATSALSCDSTIST